MTKFFACFATTCTGAGVLPTEFPTELLTDPPTELPAEVPTDPSTDAPTEIES